MADLRVDPRSTPSLLRSLVPHRLRLPSFFTRPPASTLPLIDPHLTALPPLPPLPPLPAPPSLPSPIHPGFSSPTHPSLPIPPMMSSTLLAALVALLSLGSCGRNGLRFAPLFAPRLLLRRPPLRPLPVGRCRTCSGATAMAHVSRHSDCVVCGDPGRRRHFPRIPHALHHRPRDRHGPGQRLVGGAASVRRGRPREDGGRPVRAAHLPQLGLHVRCVPDVALRRHWDGRGHFFDDQGQQVGCLVSAYDVSPADDAPPASPLLLSRLRRASAALVTARPVDGAVLGY